MKKDYCLFFSANETKSRDWLVAVKQRKWVQKEIVIRFIPEKFCVQKRRPHGSQGRVAPPASEVSSSDCVGKTPPVHAAILSLCCELGSSFPPWVQWNVQAVTVSTTRPPLGLASFHFALQCPLVHFFPDLFLSRKCRGADHRTPVNLC